MMATTGAYIQRAEELVLELLDEHHALVHPEVLSRISEGYFSESGLNIDPHHVTTALRTLHENEVVDYAKARTRGGREVAVLQRIDLGRRGTRVNQAAQRKRLLFGRYLGWAHGTVHHPRGLIGPAGEAAVRQAILLSGKIQPAEAGAGEVGKILDTKLSGPVDSGGFFVPLVDGIPQSPITVLVEVKNLRSWVYPSSIELYQLLKKAVSLQRARPDQAVLGILVCRRAHRTLFKMAKQLGFVVIDMGVQFAGNVNEDALNEVRNELYFPDLRIGTGPSVRVMERLTKSKLIPLIPGIAEAWRQNAIDDQIGDAILAAGSSRSTEQCQQATGFLRIICRSAGLPGGW